MQVLQKSRGQSENEYDYDEISATFKVRYLTSMEAYLRLHSFPIVKMSHTIYKLSVHDENQQTIVIEEGHELEGMSKLNKNTKLLAFFKLCRTDELAKTLTYDQIPYFYL